MLASSVHACVSIWVCVVCTCVCVCVVCVEFCVLCVPSFQVVFGHVVPPMQVGCCLPPNALSAACA